MSVYTESNEWFYPDGSPQRRKRERFINVYWRLVVGVAVGAGLVLLALKFLV